jgi:hypothetical protein
VPHIDMETLRECAAKFGKALTEMSPHKLGGYSLVLNVVTWVQSKGISSICDERRTSVGDSASKKLSLHLQPSARKTDPKLDILIRRSCQRLYRNKYVCRF